MVRHKPLFLLYCAFLLTNWPLAEWDHLPRIHCLGHSCLCPLRRCFGWQWRLLWRLEAFSLLERWPLSGWDSTKVARSWDPGQKFGSGTALGLLTNPTCWTVRLIIFNSAACHQISFWSTSCQEQFGVVGFFSFFLFFFLWPQTFRWDLVQLWVDDSSSESSSFVSEATNYISHVKCGNICVGRTKPSEVCGVF